MGNRGHIKIAEELSRRKFDAPYFCVNIAKCCCVWKLDLDSRNPASPFEKGFGSPRHGISLSLHYFSRYCWYLQQHIFNESFGSKRGFYLIRSLNFQNALGCSKNLSLCFIILKERCNCFGLRRYKLITLPYTDSDVREYLCFYIHVKEILTLDALCFLRQFTFTNVKMPSF